MYIRRSYKPTKGEKAAIIYRWKKLENNKLLSKAEKARELRKHFPHLSIACLQKYSKWKRLWYWLKTPEERKRIYGIHRSHAIKSNEKRKTIKNTNIQLIKDEIGGCENCGYKTCQKALEFHHVDPSEKESGIYKIAHDPDKLLQEIQKCVLLCSNCHKEVHDNIISESKILKIHQHFLNQKFKSIKDLF